MRLPLGGRPCHVAARIRIWLKGDHAVADTVTLEVFTDYV